MSRASTSVRHNIKGDSLEMLNDTSLFMSSLQNAPAQSDPFDHYMLKKLFSDNLARDLESLPFDAHSLDYNKGTREEFNPFRRYFCPEVINEYACVKTFTDIFLQKEVIAQLEEMGNVSLKNTLLRAEYAMDTDKFWLAPHTDLGVKKVTLLIYISNTHDSENWGTDIYYNAETHCKTVPYSANTALLFFASDKTWHGFEPRHINGIRKSIIVNYVTQEWRNRQELVHPTMPVY